MERDKSLPLHLKYRPQSFEEFVGAESVVESLMTVLGRENGEVRTFLFVGSSGCGKTTSARIVKSSLNCSDMDFFEYNSANTRGIDTIREITENSKYAPMKGKVKIYLIDECHKMTNDAQNALLKLLEDTPKHVRLILCTTDPEKLIKTIKTRCMIFMFPLLKRSQILKLLKSVCKEEDVDVSDSLLNLITDYSDGCPRQALVMLDQVIDMDEKDATGVLLNASVEEKTVLELCQLLLRNSKWESIAKILKSLDDDPEKIRLSILKYMEKVLLSKYDQRVVEIMDMFSEPFYTGGKSLLVKYCAMANGLK